MLTYQSFKLVLDNATELISQDIVKLFKQRSGVGELRFMNRVVLLNLRDPFHGFVIRAVRGSNNPQLELVFPLRETASVRQNIYSEVFHFVALVVAASSPITAAARRTRMRGVTR